MEHTTEHFCNIYSWIIITGATVACRKVQSKAASMSHTS